MSHKLPQPVGIGPQANDDTETHHHLHKVENQLSNESGIGLAMDEPSMRNGEPANVLDAFKREDSGLGNDTLGESSDEDMLNVNKVASIVKHIQVFKRLFKNLSIPGSFLQSSIKGPQAKWSHKQGIYLVLQLGTCVEDKGLRMQIDDATIIYWALFTINNRILRAVVDERPPVTIQVDTTGPNPQTEYFYQQNPVKTSQGMKGRLVTRSGVLVACNVDPNNPTNAILVTFSLDKQESVVADQTCLSAITFCRCVGCKARSIAMYYQPDTPINGAMYRYYVRPAEQGQVVSLQCADPGEPIMNFVYWSDEEHSSHD